MPPAPKEPTSPEEIDELIESFRRRLNYLGGIAARLRRDNVTEFSTRGIKTARKGVEGLDKLILNIEREVGRF